MPTSQWLIALISWIDGLPRWQRPIFNGALLVLAWFAARGGLVVYPILLLVAGFQRGWSFVRPFLLLPIVGVLAGALGGATYSLLLPVRRLGATGRWLGWTVAVGIYLLPPLVFLGPIADPPMRISDGATRFGWLFGTLWGGSLGYWFFGREEDPDSPDTRSPTVRGILGDAISADLDELRAAAKDDPAKLTELAEIKGNAPSRALVMHWWRVVGRLGRVPGAVYNLPYHWALDRAEAHLRTAQARWNKASGLDA